MSPQRHATTGDFAPPPPERELTVTAPDGLPLHAETHGPADGPPIVLAHGWTCSTAFWAPVIRDLTADGHRVVVYDQRGHGSSPAGLDGRPTGYSTATLADDLCAVLDAVLAPGEKAVVGGHSMGGMTLMAAAGRPELREHAAALMLCSTGAQRLAGESRVVPVPFARLRGPAHRLLLTATLPLGPVTPLGRKAIKYATMGPDAAPEAVDAAARIVHGCPRRVRAAWGGVLAGLDLAARVARLDVPTAVVAGTRDRLTPFPHARRLAAALPRLTELHRLPGLGHMTPMEAPEAVAGVLRGLAADNLRQPGAAGTSDAPKADAPKADMPKADAPTADEARIDAAKAAEPKSDKRRSVKRGALKESS
ncbi:alpha/beta hydrolase [Streptomyces sp. OF3]|uniref:Alpha/beta hydrolase n=1 Tax=Streptomyces alkaliterrae TaxID=2213162 RepID=A0A7W3ZNR9_9ACTN|nr:alpha/beta hydrolase [Streptomyces alkaliterrae]MBB1254875.1 alpha/beta hydrolase [Streptomyces alkaliterrae]